MLEDGVSERADLEPKGCHVAARGDCGDAADRDICGVGHRHHQKARDSSSQASEKTTVGMCSASVCQPTDVPRHVCRHLFLDGEHKHRYLQGTVKPRTDSSRPGIESEESTEPLAKNRDAWYVLHGLGAVNLTSQDAAL